MIDLKNIKPLVEHDKVKIEKGADVCAETLKRVDLCYIYIYAEPSEVVRAAVVILCVYETGEIFCVSSQRAPVRGWEGVFAAYSRAAQYVHGIRMRDGDPTPLTDAERAVDGAMDKGCESCEYCNSEYQGESIGDPCEGCNCDDYPNYRPIGFKR